MFKKYSMLSAVITLICSLSGCAVPTTSSGFMTDQNVPQLPPGVPKTVGVSLFSGESPINLQATDQFSAGLVSLGFEVVERQHLEEVVNELGLQQSGLISEKNIKEVGKHLGLDAVFVGSITGESSAMWVDAYLNIKMVEIQSGKILWSATAKDPRLFSMSADVKTSVLHTVKNALSMLKKDLHTFGSKNQKGKNGYQQNYESAVSTKLPNFRSAMPDFNHLSDIEILKAFRVKFPKYNKMSDDDLINLIEEKYRRQ